MDFLIHSRAGADVAATDVELDERHWAYMDQFADRMTARGPTLGADRETWTGSLHILDLPDPATAREFVALEPYNQAGLYARPLHLAVHQPARNHNVAVQWCRLGNPATWSWRG